MQEEKDRFFLELDLCGSISVAAREIGLNRNTCRQWAKKAGIRSRGVGGTAPHPGREEFFRLRKAGISRREAAKSAGVNIRTARDWDQPGNPALQRPTHLPDGTVVDYKRGVTTMTTPAGTARTVSGAPVLLPALEKPIDPRYLSLQERETIRDMSAAGASLRAVASLLGRSPSTISRGLSRNSSHNLGYQPYAAQRAAAARRPRPKDRKLLTVPRLREYVEGRAARAFVAGADQQHFDQGVSPRSGDAPDPRDDLPGPLPPGPGRAAPGNRRRAGAPAGPGARPTNPGRSALAVRGPDGHDLRAPAGGRGPGHWESQCCCQAA